MAPILGILASANYQRVTSSYESIATVTVSSGGAANVEFSSIPSTYTHLQIRGIWRSNRANAQDPIMARFNSDASTSNYTQHALYGNGTAAVGANNLGEPGILQYSGAGNNAGTGVFGSYVIDIIDYANTSKYKTLRSVGGYDNNGDGFIAINGGAWLSTSAINTIRLYPFGGTLLQQYSTFALYGIKGA